jgi:hypothetical protein
MQTRKISMEIKVIDDEHCSHKCVFWYGRRIGKECPTCRLRSIEGSKIEDLKRTKQCKESEIK